MRVMRPFTNHAMNLITRLFAGWLPGFAILTYVGRTSGRRYSTPINVFRRDGAYIFALTYGSDVQWLKNVTAAGGCEMRTRGRTIRLRTPSCSRTGAGSSCPFPSA